MKKEPITGLKLDADYKKCEIKIAIIMTKMNKTKRIEINTT